MYSISYAAACRATCSRSEERRVATNKLPLLYKGYDDMNPCLFSVKNHQVILVRIEARENINHDEYVEEEDHYNIDSDESDIDAN